MVDTSALEKQIDEMVYKLYGLTYDDIEIVEGKGFFVLREKRIVQFGYNT